MKKDASMNDEQYEKGLEVRRAVMGDSYVDKALNSATDFTQPLQDLVAVRFSYFAV